MAGKARRVASRQAQLNRKRKKQQRGPSGIPTASQLPQEADGPEAELAVPQRRASAPPRAAAVPAVDPAPGEGRPAPTGPAPSPTRARGERPPSTAYVGAELRRILIMCGTVLAVIIALGIVL